MCSVFGFQDSYTLADITDEDFDYVEKKLKDKMLKLISTELDASYFVGEYFKNDPDAFEITRADRKRLMTASKHIKDVEEKNQMHFSLQKKQKVDVDYTVFESGFCGFYFTKEKSNKKPLSLDAESELNKSLTDCLRKCLIKFPTGIEWSHIEKSISDDLISIQICGNKASATVKCVFCMFNGKENKISVFLKQAQKADKSYWVLSNFSKHLKQTHSKKQTLNDIVLKKIDDDVADIQSSSSDRAPSPIEPIVPVISNEHFESLASDCDISSPEKKFDEIIVYSPTNSRDSDLCVMKSEPDNALFMQISTQIVLMNETVLKNSLKEKPVSIKINNETHIVQVVTMKSDGSCLFRALAHQLFREKLGSYQAEQTARNLRRDVVLHIKANYDDFVPQLKNTVYDLKDETEIMNIETECWEHLNKNLPKLSCWGGMETLKAVMNMYKVNILIFNEMSTCSFHNRFNNDYDRTICIAFRLVPEVKKSYDAEQNEEKRKEIKLEWNHYDSITSVDQNDIFTLANTHSLNTRIDSNDEELNQTITLQIEKVID